MRRYSVHILVFVYICRHVSGFLFNDKFMIYWGIGMIAKITFICNHIRWLSNAYVQGVLSLHSRHHHTLQWRQMNVMVSRQLNCLFMRLFMQPKKQTIRARYKSPRKGPTVRKTSPRHIYLNSRCDTMLLSNKLFPCLNSSSCLYP